MSRERVRTYLAQHPQQTGKTLAELESGSTEESTFKCSGASTTNGP